MNRARPEETFEDPPAVGEQWKQRLREEERRLDVDAEQLVELLLGRLGVWREHPDAGVVDQVAEPLGAEASERGAHLGGERGERRAVADVEAQGRRGYAERVQLLDETVTLGGVAMVGADDADAGPSEMRRHAAAEATARAGDESEAGVRSAERSGGARRAGRAAQPAVGQGVDDDGQRRSGQVVAERPVAQVGVRGRPRRRVVRRRGARGPAMDDEDRAVDRRCQTRRQVGVVRVREQAAEPARTASELRRRRGGGARGCGRAGGARGCGRGGGLRGCGGHCRRRCEEHSRNHRECRPAS